MRERRGIAGFFTVGGLSAFALVVALLAAIAATARVVSGTMHARFERDVARMVFNDNLELLDAILASRGVARPRAAPGCR